MSVLEVGVILAACWCVGAMVGLYFKAKAFGTRTLFSMPAGEAMAGVRYAFTKGMAPQAKESVRMNPLSYLAGMLYHTGIFAGFALLVARLVGLPTFKSLGIVAMFGALGGVALLIKRLAKAHLRGISCPDDFVSNTLATVFPLLAGAACFVPSLTTIWLIETVVLLIYAPLGKIRHCLFFFSTRYFFGAFFGRRGVFPPAVKP